MEQNNTIKSFAELASTLRAAIGQINVDAGKRILGTSVKYTTDIPLAYDDEYYEGAISKWLDVMSDNNGVITDRDLVRSLNPCLADANAISGVHYAHYLRKLAKDGVAETNRQIYDWKIGYPLWFDQDTKTLTLTVLGIPQDMEMEQQDAIALLTTRKDNAN